MLNFILNMIKSYWKKEDTHQQKLEKIKKQWNKHVNIYIGKSLSKSEKDAFFGPEDETIFLHYKSIQRWPQILRDIGIATSTSQAIGSGWNRLVEEGFQDLHLNGLSIWKGNGHGLHPHRITILRETIDY